MSTEKPTAPKENTSVVSPSEHWQELRARAGGEPETDEEVAASRGEPEGDREEKEKISLSRRARFLVATALIVLAAALAWVIASALVGGGSTQRSRPASDVVHAKTPKTVGERTSRARWVREPDEAARPRRTHTTPAAPHVSHRAHSRHGPRPLGPPPEEPGQPPASGAAPPEQGVPAPSAPEEPEEKPGLRDGATESTEFGL